MGEQTLRQLALELNELFVIPASTDSLLAPVVALIPKAPPSIGESAQAFCSNVRSLVLTAGIPYMLAIAAAHNRRHQLLLCAAELEVAIQSEKGLTIPDEWPQLDAGERMKGVIGSNEGRDALNCEACDFLLRFAKTDENAEASAQLVLQQQCLPGALLRY